MKSSQADLVRDYAQKNRVFTRSDLIRDIGEKAAGALAQMVGSEITRQAVGVYSLTGILPNDSRVLSLIKETGAKALSDEIRMRDSQKAEQRSAAILESKTKKTQNTIDRVRQHFIDNAVASSYDLKRLYGQSGPSCAKALSDKDEIHKVRDGLWVRNGVDPFGKDMKVYVESNSIELATVKRELEEVAEIDRSIAQGSIAAEWSISRIPGRPTTVYLNLTNIPSIFARSIKGRLAWFGTKGKVSPQVAERISRMILDPMPGNIGDLIRLVENGDAPTGMRRRHGEYREYVRPEETEDRPSGRYTIWDTHVLDPRRLGNGLADEVILEIDDREDDRLVTMLTGIPNLHIIRTHLEMADFVARYDNRTLAIERKTSEDLSASLDDNRLAEQVHRMSDSAIPCCFVIEGGITGTRSQPLPRLVALQSRLNFGMNMPVIETIDLAHTAYVIVTTIRDHFFGSGSAFDLKPIKIPSLGPVERAMHMLQLIPGISQARAAALLSEFGTIRNIGQASIKEIQKVDGIGKKTAESLHEVLNAGAAIRDEQ